ncbi:hypothetical protein WA1_27810 [Scytonema hofmannii PCC 7110]|uniref:Uncharacterized protein n=1 Tax=Scytonema hofmannii PCC 7110 TaxID=128403 RepID=A0A139X6K6_9CYAN|nr:hypothetical protein [Scytonema hofmannii]KYC40338.1 hypothetical protein WA1_27810 [Scytonema hofmannii PCC 7110]
MARIATQTSFQEGYSLEFEVKLYREISDADRNKPTTLMRRKVLIKEDFSANTLAALSSEPLDDLSEKGLVLLDRHDQPIRNHVALCDDKASYLETNESRSYFLRRVCYDLSTCGVVLPQQDRQWMQSDFFPALKSREPEERDFEYGCDMLLRMRRGLDFAPAVEMLKEENYLVWLLNCLPEVQEDIFQSMALDRFSFPALFH